MAEGKKVDEFCKGLRHQVRLEVTKSGSQTIYEASKTDLNVDTALFGSGIYRPIIEISQKGTTPMEIGKFQ